MSAGKIGAGAAGYFEREVASGREDYYAGVGEAPGLWRGEGAEAAGLDGRIVTGQLGALLEQTHPVTGEALGNGYKVAGEYVDRFGNIKVRAKVAAIDATFSVPKSVSELFAVGGPGLQQEVVDACQIAVDASIAHLDRHAAFSRAGKAGVRQVDTDGLIVGEFMHRTSRAGDPQLHFHLLVSNRVHCADGKWRALDGRRLYPELKTAGMVGQSVMRAELTARLGVEWGPVSAHGQADVVGVPTGLMELHSKRTKAVEAHAARTIRVAETKLGRSLTPMERAEKFDAAAVQTRAVKAKDIEPEQGLTQRWIAEARAEGFDPDLWLGDTLSRVIGRQIGLPGLDDQTLINAVLDDLTTAKSVWGRTDATRAIARRVTANPGETGPELAVRIEGLTGHVLEHGRVVELTVPEIGVGPVRASDGVSEFVVHNAETYTTVTTLEREQRVLDHFVAGRDADMSVAFPMVVSTVIDERSQAGRALSADQVTAVAELTMSGDAVSVLVGPAGAGKSATIGVAAQAWEQSGFEVRGLAVSAKAAAVLREEAGIGNADTLAKLLHEHRKLDGPGGGYRVGAGDVLVLDEASMVSTADMAALIDIAADAGAKIVAVGDWRQLGAVDAGGLFRLMAHDGPVAELERVWRFTQPWERHTSLLLRDADPAAIASYHEHGRITGADHEQTLATAFDYWADTRRQGQSVIVTATDRETVAEFNVAARQHLIDTGVVDARLVDVDGPVGLGVGDQILTLRNDRRLLTTDGGFVRNGDRWIITGHNWQGLQLDSASDPGVRAVLPDSYVQAGHVDYAYATTVHKAQGVTVDRAVTIIDASTTAGSLYVGATRGRDRNQMLAVCEPGYDEYGLEHHGTPGPVDVIAAAMQRQDLERTATEVLRERNQPDLGWDHHLPDDPHPDQHNLSLNERDLSGHDLNEHGLEEPFRHEAPPVGHRLPSPGIGGPGDDDPDGHYHPSVTPPRQPSPSPTPSPMPEPVLVPELLDGAEIRELGARRARLETELSEAGIRLRESQTARTIDQRELRELTGGIGWEQKMIDQTRQRINQIHDRSLWQSISMTPADRIRDRKELFKLEQKITNHEAAITGLGFRVRRQERLIDRNEHSLGGRAGDQDRYDNTKTRVDTAINQIDHTLTSDIQARAQRVLDHGPDPSILRRYRIDSVIDRNDLGALGQWAATIARAEQHHTAWDGIDHDTHGHSDLGHAMQRSQRTLTNSINQLETTLHPPTIHIRPERGFGISR